MGSWSGSDGLRQVLRPSRCPEVAVYREVHIEDERTPVGHGRRPDSIGSPWGTRQLALRRARLSVSYDRLTPGPAAGLSGSARCQAQLRRVLRCWLSMDFARMVVLASIAAVLALSPQLARSETGDGGDPTFVNFYVSVPKHLRLTKAMPATITAASEANGPTPTRFSGVATLGVPRGSHGVRSVAARARFHGVAGDQTRVAIRWSTAKRAAARRAASKAGRHVLRMVISIAGTPAGQSRQSKRTLIFRVHL
jgi:hypothetical protein